MEHRTVLTVASDDRVYKAMRPVASRREDPPSSHVGEGGNQQTWCSIDSALDQRGDMGGLDRQRFEEYKHPMMRRTAAGTKHDIDLRDIPSYGFTEAAHYLLIPPSTIRCWVTGRYYPSKVGRQFSKPVIQLPNPNTRLLSFMNLVEIHVLDAIRRKHDIQLEKVRTAVQYLSRQFPSRHPLADREFVTDGLDLFIKKLGQLINVSRDGQLAMGEVLQAHLLRIERDLSGIPVKLYPFTRKRAPEEAHEEPKVVVIDPLISFGRPVLAGTGVATSVIAERYKAGETIDELAGDYGLQRLQIEEAVRCELTLEAA